MRTTRYILAASAGVVLVRAAQCGTQKLDILDIVDPSHYSNWGDLLCNPQEGFCRDDSLCNLPVVVDTHHELTLSREGPATRDECLQGFVS